MNVLDYGKSFEFSFTVVIAKKDDKMESLTCDIKKTIRIMVHWEILMILIIL